MNLETLKIKHKTKNNQFKGEIPLSYECFGPKLGSAPIVIVNHALTGNSSVIGEKGWWNRLIGFGKCIDTIKFTVLAFNIPGNGYDGFVIENYEAFSVYDIAEIFLKGLQELKIDTIYTIIGGSLGGSIAWQMAALSPNLFEYVIPVATDWKATDWVLANCRIQKQLLENSAKPLHDARMHAMTFYRTPQSINAKFNRTKNAEHGIFNIESWLLHHGEKLQQRFRLSSYKLMNHLLTTVEVAESEDDFLEKFKNSSIKFILIGVDTDYYFTNQEIAKANLLLKKNGNNSIHKTIKSIYGHDAFLIEYNQLQKILQPIFKIEETYEYHRNIYTNKVRATVDKSRFT